VQRGRALTRAEAISHRASGGNIVVCGPDTSANAFEARAIEAAVGACIHHPPHLDVAGARALPHFQQRAAPPEGHSFYETHVRQAIQ
jgi:hypothetical protein